MPPDDLTHRRFDLLQSKVTHLDSAFKTANPFATAFVSTIDTLANIQATASHIAEDFIRFTLFQHGMAYHKVYTSRDTEFSQHEILIGNLLPADHLLAAISVTFPMITKPFQYSAGFPISH
jgi:hypothetical protein